jgi:ATP-binding cassette subfamily D (ALD) protein 3
MNSNRSYDPVETFTDDIYSWAHSFADILCNSIKNSFDIIFFTVKISYDFGWKGPTAIMLWYLFSGCVLRFLSPPLGQMAAKVRTLEYEYKELCANVNENAEQLAFYRRNTNETEKEKIKKAFQVIYCFSIF